MICKFVTLNITEAKKTVNICQKILHLQLLNDLMQNITEILELLF
jgi:hypothetical protein